jgi:hypothetical protein
MAALPISPTEQLARLRLKRAAAARVAPGAFTELVLRDNQGRQLTLAPMHREFHRLAEKHKHLVLMAHFESGKTENLAIARTLWELGRDPSLTFAVISKTENQALKTTRRIREIIETSAELRMVFPDLRPGRPWGDTAFCVNRPHGARTPSVQAFGIDVAILGDRVDRMIIDDAMDWESARTDTQRRSVVDKTQHHLMSRLTDRARVIVSGVPFHVEDLISTLGRQSGWHLARFPVENDDGSPRWPQRWPKDRIEEVRVTLGPAAAARQLDLKAVSDADASFLESDITNAIARGEKATALGGWNGRSVLVNRSPYHKVVLGCDPAVGLKPHNDLSAIVAVLIHPNGDREVIGVDSGRWLMGTIVEHIDAMNMRFAADVVAVESNASQDYLAQQLAGNRQIRVLRHATGRGKMSLAWEAEELAKEMHHGKWIFPSVGGRVRDPEVGALVRDMTLMTRADRHTPDRVSALAMARWAIDQSTRLQAEWFNLDTTSR